MKNINHKYFTINEFLSKDECDLIIKKYKNEIELKPGEVISGLDTKIRKSSVGFIKNIELIDNKLKKILKDNIPIKGFNATGLSPYQFTKYEVDDYYHWHTDSDDAGYKNRYCSIVIQLNDDYKGGYLQLKNSNNDVYTFEKKIGNLSIFFSNILHRVTSVESGIRYSLVNWVSLENIKGYKKTLL